ncbi:MAG: replication-associated recombination protein A [Armatimonadota bacterium]|nr:replication-associated recombination protein A [Armatimonadota bacterium]
MTTLFGEQEESAAQAPLAARMRPRDLDEFAGQEHILGADKLLRRAIERDELTSAIFWGPPGCGKSTLASIIAAQSKFAFENFSAVTAGVADIRKVIERAGQRIKINRQRTILFVDEIHRFNKAQQDAFLPHVENGTVVLIGATTENPYFEVNSPLISRSRIFRFEPLSNEHLEGIVRRALEDKDRGLGAYKAQIDDEALRHIVDVSGGDARNALNALELAVMTTPPDETGVRKINVEIAAEAIQQRVLKYDKSGDNHYDAISAFIKSMRGSDPDAALYWLARMISAGEDPKFIARRMIIQAAEDVGNADPMALLIANAAAQAVQFVGLPEAQIPLAQAAIYISCAPKSNASYIGISRAMKDVAERQSPPVPIHLRDSNYPGAKKLGHGEGYKYPHDFPDHYVEQEYVPESAKSSPYYEPSDLGHEAKIKKRLEGLRRESEKNASTDSETGQ